MKWAPKIRSTTVLCVRRKGSVVMAGEMRQGLDAPRLRVVLRDILAAERRELPPSAEITKPLGVAESAGSGSAS